MVLMPGALFGGGREHGSFRRNHHRISFSLSLPVFAAVFLFLPFPTVVDSKWVEGVVDTTYSGWEFLTRFCFLSTHGTLEYDIQYPVGYGTQDILLYFDTPGQWDSIYDRGKTCTEKTSVLSSNSNQIISLNTSHTQTSAYSGCSLIQYNGDTWYNCVGKRAFKSMRERWWYIALARCGESKDSVSGLYARYKIHMTNGDDLLHQEYSADEFYILPINIAFLVLYIIITVLSGICAAILRQRHLFHTTYKLYLVSVVIWMLSLILKVIAWGYYGLSGWQWSPVDVSGRVLQGMSQVVFVLLLILMGKGYTITRGFLSTASIVKITAFMAFYFVTTCGLFVWESLFFDPGKVLYFYESPPGYCMVSLQLIGWIWFLYAAIFTLKHTDSKSLFYVPFFTFYTIWFWAGPIIIMVAMYAMAKWSREKTVNGVEQLVAFLGHAIFLVLTRPSAANSNFPYHVRTTQIDTLKDDKSTYHFDNDVDDTSKYVIKSGPNLDFFITAKPKSHKDDIDNISTISFDGGNDNGNDIDAIKSKAKLDDDKKDGAKPVDLKNCWFDVLPQPPGYEEISRQPNQFLIPALQLTPPTNTNLPPPPPPQPPSQFISSMPPPPLSSNAPLPAIPLPKEIPLALISPPTRIDTNDTSVFESNPLTTNYAPIRPRLSIISETTLPFKKTLPPVALSNSAIAKLTKPFPHSSSATNLFPPNLNQAHATPSFISKINSNNPLLKKSQSTPTIADFNKSTPIPPNSIFTTPPPPTPTPANTNIHTPRPPITQPPFPSDTITPSHLLPAPAFTPPTPRSNKHTFSSTIALLTKTADATNIDDIIKNKKEEKDNKKDKKKGKNNKVIVSQTVQERESKLYNESMTLDTGSKNVLAPVGLPSLSTPRMGGPRKLPSDMPPLPPANPLVDKYINKSM